MHQELGNMKGTFITSGWSPVGGQVEVDHFSPFSKSSDMFPRPNLHTFVEVYGQMRNG